MVLLWLVEEPVLPVYFLHAMHSDLASPAAGF